MKTIRKEETKFFVLAGISLAVALYLLISTAVFLSDAGTCVATVVERDRLPFSPIYVDYSIDGTPYQHVFLGVLGYGADVGEELKIYFDNADRGSIRWVGEFVSEIAAFLLLTLVFTTLGITSLRSRKRRNAEIARLLSLGVTCSAVVTDIWKDFSDRRMHRYPSCTLQCVRYDEDGGVCFYSSDRLPRAGAEAYLHHTVTVYCDPQNQNSYYVDLSTLSRDGETNSGEGDI